MTVKAGRLLKVPTLPVEIAHKYPLGGCWLKQELAATAAEAVTDGYSNQELVECDADDALALSTWLRMS